MSTTRKLLTGSLVLFTAVCCPLSYIATVAAGSFFWNPSDNAVLEQVAVEIYSPPTVQVGDTYLIEVNLSSTSDVPRTVDSIDFHFADEGIEIKRSKPGHKEYNILFEWHSYTFEQPLAVGASVTIQFEASSSQAGTFPILVAVCIDSPNSCADFEGQVEVRQPEKQETSQDREGKLSGDAQ